MTMMAKTNGKNFPAGVSIQGYKHYLDGKNNQDACFASEDGNMVLVVDGCSDAEHAEVGANLFVQIFAKNPEKTNPDKFEEVVKQTFETIYNAFRSAYESDEAYEKEFVENNLLFTIVAAFRTSTGFIVKLYGDGYIITKNKDNRVSYMCYTDGDYPCYYVYRYMTSMKDIFSRIPFRTVEFSNEDIVALAISTDGIAPAVKFNMGEIDNAIFLNNPRLLKNLLADSESKFGDDTTIAILHAKKEESDSADETGINSFVTDNEIPQITNEGEQKPGDVGEIDNIELAIGVLKDENK